MRRGVIATAVQTCATAGLATPAPRPGTRSPGVVAGQDPGLGEDPGHDPAATLLYAADMALLRAKTDGRDRVCAADQPVSA